MASEGLRQLAENGNTRMLESELKAKSDHIRTIIKARGISYPNITGKTFAVFRVDNRHHLMSIVSMLDPSPDWIVGVSSLELCLRNCSWIDSKVLNLYPWDAGTDTGVTYISPNQPSLPRQPIKRLRPSDPRSPFFDPSGAEMKPLARLSLSRQRLYEKVCESALTDPKTASDACATSPWSPWSPCSATCGRGVKYKQRRYETDAGKYTCHKRLTERAGCEAVQKHCPRQPARQPADDPMCMPGPWGEWSGCSASCGRGVKTRSRRFRSRAAAKVCGTRKRYPDKLEENLECWGGDCGRERDCGGEERWSAWSPCSVSCGTGFKVRYRLSSSANWAHEEYEEEEEEDCSKETVECYEKKCGTGTAEGFVCGLPKDVGECKSNVDRWYFDSVRGNCEIFSYSGCDGNANNFRTLEQCQKICASFQRELTANLTGHKRSHSIQNDAINADEPDELNASVDCIVTKWSNWGDCSRINKEHYCGHGIKIKSRQVTQTARNGGRPCPKHLIKRKKCFVDCPSGFDNVQVDCVVSAWSEWSACYCAKKYQERRRAVLARPTRNGAACPERVESRVCTCA